VSCDDIKNDTQCFSSTTALDGTCSWLYGSNDSTNTSGSCISVNDDDITCEDLNRTSQCGGGGGITSLANKCGLYNNVCKTLCSEIGETTCKSTFRSNDCFWIEKNGTQYSGGCVNKV
jgi:hypothetical protein